MAFERITRLMGEKVAEEVFPGGQVCIAAEGRVVFEGAFGNRQTVPELLPASVSTVYDIASLTKPLATAIGIAMLVQEGSLSFEDALGKFLPAPPGKEGITIRQLLSHSSGLPAYRNYFSRLNSAPIEHRRGLLLGLAMDEPLEAMPGERASYSDLGYVLLGAVLEKVSGERLDKFASERIFKPLGIGLGFRPIGESAPLSDVAATEDCPLRGKVLAGEVHDENCWAAGGVCGHAGLFGTAREVMKLLTRLWRCYRGESDMPLKPELVREMFRRQSPVSTWGLGFDHPDDVGSSAGVLFPKDSVGHLGYTGCSFWMELERGITVVLLTNRVHPTRTNEAIRRFRPLFHDAAYQDAMEAILK